MFLSFPDLSCTRNGAGDTPETEASRSKPNSRTFGWGFRSTVSLRISFRQWSISYCIVENVVEEGKMAMGREPDSRVWLVTGCSSGLGRALAEALVKRGHSVVATARNPDTLSALREMAPDQVLPLALDVTKPESIEAAREAALAWRGKVDVLVNNAGYGLVGAAEEVSDAEALAAFDANLFGIHRVVRSFLPTMRAHGQGHIVNVSSMLGHVGAAGFTFYAAVKFAVEGFSESLAKEVEPFGIKVTIVAPGPFRTAFRSKGLQMAEPKPPYDASLAEFRKNLLAADGTQPGDPRRGAELIIDAVSDPNPPLRLVLGEIAMAQVQAKQDRVVADISRWKDRSAATAFPQ
jgi:NAD(P)-dependent dehydrogenase (short-subunit alcohol dehydrogenase family)